MRDHESSSFCKLARNKWICRETCDFFRDKIKTVFKDVYTIVEVLLYLYSVCF